MKYIKALFLGLFFLLTAQVVYSNGNETLYEDKCYVHLDKSFYVTGEVLWYKLYLPKALKDKPLTVRVFIFDQNKQVVDNFFLKSEGKTFVDGYYKIPFNAESGVYSLVFAAQNGNYKSTTKLAELLIPIYNDLETVDIAKDKLTVPYQEGELSEPGQQDLKISIELEKQKYKTRDEVISNITVTDASGNPVQANLSVSVRDWELTGGHVFNQNTLEAGENHELMVYDNFDNDLYFPADYRDNDGNPIEANLIGIWSRLENRMHFAKSDEKGQVYLKMPDFEGTIPVQFMAYKDTTDIKVDMETNLTLTKSGELIYTEGILKYLTLSRQRKKIFQIYTTLEYNIQPVKKPLEVLEMQPDRTFNLKEYEPFDNLPAYFLEITSAGVLFQKERNGRYVGKVYNPRQTFEGYYPGTALFIVDGKATMDGHFVANLEYNTIEKADIYLKPKSMRRQFSAMATDGAVVFTTNDPNFLMPANVEEDIKEINGLQSEAKFPVFQLADIQNNPHIPFFRPQLYWNPDVTTDETGATQLAYTQSDDVSTFQIEVVAQDEKGRIGKATIQYSVVAEMP